MLPNTIEWIADKKILRLLDQRSIPHEVKFRDCISCEDVASSIEDMAVRGAPAIGVAAAYGVVIASWRGKEFIRPAIERLSLTRPTAVNLYWGLRRMSDVFESNSDSADLPLLLECEAVKIHQDDISINRHLSEYGQTLLHDEAAVITHCNAGSLATAGYGTALGVFRAAAEHGKKLKIYADETRPRLQGAKLTAFELFEDGFDVTVICDSMAAFLMSKVKIDAVVTGADRIAANGDTANKIGTYSLAVAAQKHGVPFYIAAPISTIDIKCPCGDEIPIEERDPDEVYSINGIPIFSKSINVWNPAFDVTPSDLITGIITEKGILKAPYSESIKRIFEELEILEGIL